jgi:Na+/H+-dicarboxylate symporter
LHQEIAEISIVFGTVLNKNCATMSVFAVTIAVCRMLNIPLSLSELVMMIAPVMILGLESPGIPGGAGYFMSPIVGVLLGAPNMSVFVTTFIAVYSGLVPMFSTAGNTTDDGVVGAFLQDVFGRFIWGDKPLVHPQVEEVL